MVRKRFDRKGISTIVSTLMILLLVFVAIGILWVVIRNFVQAGAEEVSLGKFTLDLKIDNVAINSAANSVDVTVKRNTGAGDFTGIKFVFDDGSNSESIVYNTTLLENEKTKFSMTLSTINLSNLETIRVIPIFTLSSGKTSEGDVKDTYVLQASSTSSSPSSGTSTTCNNGIIDSGEVCDGTNLTTTLCSDVLSGSTGTLTCNSDCTYNTNACVIASCGDGTIDTVSSETCDNGTSLNGVVCTASYGSTCTYCSSSCQIATITGPYCGDGLIDSTNEVCDGTNLTTTLCSVAVGSSYTGNVACSSSCSYDTSGCSLVSSGGSGTTPVVESVTETQFGSSTASHLVSMPSSVNSGDLLIILFVVNSVPSVTTPSEWTNVFSRSDAYYDKLVIFVKISDGTEGGTSIDLVSGENKTAAAQVLRISNWYGSLSGLEISSSVSESGTTKNPDSLTATWGALENLWIAVASGGNDDASFIGFPTNYYSTTSTVSGGGTDNGCEIGSAARGYNTDTEDPSEFILSGGESGYALTMVVRPSA